MEYLKPEAVFYSRGPNSHVVITQRVLSDLQRDREKLKYLQQGFLGKKFSSKVSDLMKTYLVVALSSVPTLAIKAAAYFIPIGVSAFLLDHEILPSGVEYIY